MLVDELAGKKGSAGTKSLIKFFFKKTLKSASYSASFPVFSVLVNST